MFVWLVLLAAAAKIHWKLSASSGDKTKQAGQQGRRAEQTGQSRLPSLFIVCLLSFVPATSILAWFTKLICVEQSTFLRYLWKKLTKSWIFGAMAFGQVAFSEWHCVEWHLAGFTMIPHFAECCCCTKCHLPFYCTVTHSSFLWHSIDYHHKNFYCTMASALTYWFVIDYSCKKFYSTITNSLTYHNMYLITAKKVLLYSEHHASLLQHGIDSSPKTFYSIMR